LEIFKTKSESSIIIIIIIIIIRLQSSRPQVSSSCDGGLGPFPTADYHLAGYQDPRRQ